MKACGDRRCWLPKYCSPCHCRSMTSASPVLTYIGIHTQTTLMLHTRQQSASDNPHQSHDLHTAHTLGFFPNHMICVHYKQTQKCRATLNSKRSRKKIKLDVLKYLARKYMFKFFFNWLDQDPKSCKENLGKLVQLPTNAVFSTI